MWKVNQGVLLTLRSDNDAKPLGPNVWRETESYHGLIQNGSVTEENFIEMLAILLITRTPTVVRHRESGNAVARTVSPLQIGDYDISCDSRFSPCTSLGWC